MDQRAWTECHVAAFEYFAGVPSRLVPDNLKTGVDKPDLYDPKLNRSYAELAAHYGCLVDPARARKPKDKPKVERPMPYVRDSFWRGREFTSLEQMQAAAETWSRDVAGQRQCRPLDGAAPAAVFAASEQQALKPLPAEPFVLATWAKAKVGPDIHARVEKVLYSVPWKHIGKTCDVRITATMVQFFIGRELVKTHPRKERGKQTDFSDYLSVTWNHRPGSGGSGSVRYGLASNWGENRWGSSNSGRSGPCWAVMSWRPGGCGSGLIWVARPGRSMLTHAGWRSTWTSLSGRTSTRPRRTAPMSRCSSAS
jgi:hypothetical protein